MQKHSISKVMLYCCLILASCLSLPVAFAAPKAPTEYDIKAAFLYNFIKFVDWPEEKIPADTNQPFILGIIGEDLFKDSINIIKGEKAKGRDIIIKYFKCEHKSEESNNQKHVLSSEQIEAFRKCHLLYICPSNEKQLPDIIKAVKGANVLTIGESKNFLEKGGIIQFVMEEDKVGFGANLKAAREQNLKLSSRLLKLARTIIKDLEETFNTQQKSIRYAYSQKQ
ncbi:MAG: YfiR family protein [Sedimentisphaerales bacterium]|nr:YfiR family protein [Sedimentisphaerales bacterium]